MCGHVCLETGRAGQLVFFAILLHDILISDLVAVGFFHELQWRIFLLIHNRQQCVCKKNWLMMDDWTRENHFNNNALFSWHKPFDATMYDWACINISCKLDSPTTQFLSKWRNVGIGRYFHFKLVLLLNLLVSCFWWPLLLLVLYSSFGLSQCANVVYTILS